MKRITIIILSLAIALVTSIGTDAKVKNKQSARKRTVSTQSVKRTYIKKVNSLRGYGDNYGYFLTDITGDGTPELWVKYGTCEADYMLDVYTYSKSGLKRIMHTNAGHTEYYGYPGDNYVIAHWAHMGYEAITHISYSGKSLREKVIYESPGEVSDYQVLKEPCFDFIPFTNTREIEYYF